MTYTRFRTVDELRAAISEASDLSRDLDHLLARIRERAAELTMTDATDVAIIDHGLEQAREHANTILAEFDGRSAS